MKMTVSKKLLSGFLSVIVLLSIIAGMAIYQISQLNTTYTFLIESEAKKLELINEAEAQVWKQIASIRGFMVTKNEQNIVNFEESVDKYNYYIETLEPLLYREDTIALFTDFTKLASDYQEAATTQLQFIKSGNEREAVKLMSEVVEPITNQLSTKTTEFVSLLDTELVKEKEKTRNQSESANMFMILISIFAVAIALLMTFIISRMIATPVKLASEAIEKIAGGDLSIDEVKVKNKDEIGTLVDSINVMVFKLKTMIGQVQDSSHSVLSNSEELAASAEQSTSAAQQVAVVTQRGAEGTELQLQQFSNVTNSVNEMASGINQIASSSEDMLHEAEKTSLITKEGSKSIENVVQQMNQIYVSVENASNSIHSLEKRSSAISNIVEMITAIADQTNLLALNAAIEAARAGNHGKGFAVVADEVRKLAEESKKSADQITEMICLIQLETKEAVEAMEKGSIQVKTGLENTKEANEAFSNISSAIEAVADKVKDVSASVEEMTALSSEISTSIGLVKEVAEKSVEDSQESSAATEETLAAMQEVAASATALSHLAEDLQDVISKFKV